MMGPVRIAGTLTKEVVNRSNSPNVVNDPGECGKRKQTTELPKKNMQKRRVVAPIRKNVIDRPSTKIATRIKL